MLKIKEKKDSFVLMHGLHRIKEFTKQEYMLYAEAVVNHINNSKTLKVVNKNDMSVYQGAYKYHLAKNVALSALYDVKKWLKQVIIDIKGKIKKK